MIFYIVWGESGVCQTLIFNLFEPFILDNCWKENKNKYLFSFLASLLELKISTEISCDYLMVGHTGNEVDQLFSIIANELKDEILTIEELKEKITSAPLEPRGICRSLMFIFDWKRFIDDKLSNPPLQYTSKYNSFSFTVESGDVKFRGKRLPQDTESGPRGGIRIVKKDIVFEAVGSADFRIENINFDEIWKGLNLIMPQLALNEQRRVKLSWDRLRDSLENLPRRRSNLRKMKITDLPKQKPEVMEVPNHLVEAESVNELTGDKFPEIIEEGEFDTEICEDMDVVVYTKEKCGRPWVGRVLKLLEGKKFLLHWFTRKTSRSKTFYSLTNSDGSPSIAEQDNDSVMFWCMSEKRTLNSFSLSSFWLEAIHREYEKLDSEEN